MLLKLGRTFKEKDIPLTVMTLSLNGTLNSEFELAGIRVFSIFNLTELSKLNRYTQFIGWMYHGNIAASLLGKILKKRVIHNVRQSLQTYSQEKFILKLAIRVNAWLSKSSDAVIYNSHRAREQHENKLGFSGQTVYVIPNGFPVTNAISSLSKKPIVINVGRFHRDKDHKTFIQAALKILEAGYHPEFWLVGRDVNLNNSQLTSLIPPDKLPSFRLMGEVQDVQGLYAQAQIFVLSSMAEAFPNVLGEAMGAGLLCLATNVGDAALILGDERWIVPPQDPSAMAAKLKAVLDLSPVEKEALSKKNQRRIAENYSMNRIADLYLNVF